MDITDDAMKPLKCMSLSKRLKFGKIMSMLSNNVIGSWLECVHQVMDAL